MPVAHDEARCPWSMTLPLAQDDDVDASFTMPFLPNRTWRNFCCSVLCSALT